ncbi:hypothetical protein Q7P37_006924 [Cladosporium fusiforme]
MKDGRIKCVVVGAGPVGALTALYAARRGWQVEVYELRGDLRDASTTPLNFTKSINLALSERGINAMRHSDSPKLVDAVLSGTIPMHGRMIHDQDKNGNLTEESQQYDVHGRFIRAVDRAHLNKLLLDELEGLDNVQLFFNHKLTGVDFDTRKAWLERKKVGSPQTADGAQADQSQQGQLHPATPRPQEFEIDFDLILGCDGAHSSVRYHMMKYLRMDYSQTYIDTLWCEFRIPPAHEIHGTPSPSATNGFATSPNHLHIWPGSDQMFIAIPSTDQSFTCTLFAPASTFDEMSKVPCLIDDFFDEYFPGVTSLISPDALHDQFTANPHLPLISLKCSPHAYSAGGGVILGDAAHAMLPFYGQGMNAGLEDVRVLFSHFDRATQEQHQNPRSTLLATLQSALESYSTERVPDAHTINDLASANYWEMHSGVRSPLYLARKSIEEFLSDKVPSSGFQTQYARVSFSNQRYSEVQAAVQRQAKVLLRGILGAVLVPVVVWAGWWVWRWNRATGTGRMAVKGGVGLGAWVGGVVERVGRVFT